MDRQLTDTAYLSKAAKDYLAAICSRNSIWVSAGRLTAILRRFWGFNTLLSCSPDPGFKNRSDHRHHALDSLVIGLCDRALIAQAARVNSGKGYGDLKAPDCPIERRDIEKRLASMVVSYKPNHGVEGKLYAETALAKRSYVEMIQPEDLQEHEINRVTPQSIRQYILTLTEAQGFRKAKKALQENYEYLRVFRDKWVTRAPVKSLSERDISNICDPRIREQLRAFILDHQGEKLQDVLSRFSEKANIRSVRYFPKDQTPSPIGSCDNKAYMPSDYYRVDIWKIPPRKEKSKYEGVFVSRPEAMQELANKDNSSLLRKPHPAAKLMMSLCKNDIIELSNGTARELCRIAGFSTTNNQIDIRPIYASDTITAWMRDTSTYLVSSFWPQVCDANFFRSINMLFNEYQVKRINTTVDGRFFYR